MGDWEGVRLHVVTGKGGTGKTTVAAAFALALAAGGRKVLVAEVEGRQGLAQVFDVPPLTYDERRIAAAPGGGEVCGIAIDAQDAMSEYLDMFYRLGMAGRALDKIGFVEFATTIAPGLRDVLLTGKTYEATRRRDARNAYVYDAVVLDAPPTGRITRFLDVNTSVTSLARVGPISRQATSITELVHSPRTAVHLVTMLEDMPVQETADAAAELHAAGIPLGAVIVNQVRQPHLAVSHLAASRRGRLDRDEIADGLKKAGLDSSEAIVDRLVEEARYHAVRSEEEKRERTALKALNRPTYDLPRYPMGIDPAAVYELAEILTERGAA